MHFAQLWISAAPLLFEFSFLWQLPSSLAANYFIPISSDSFLLFYRISTSWFFWMLLLCWKEPSSHGKGTYSTRLFRICSPIPGRKNLLRRLQIARPWACRRCRKRSGFVDANQRRQSLACPRSMWSNLRLLLILYLAPDDLRYQCRHFNDSALN